MAVTSNDFGSALAKMLGLPGDVIWFELRCAVDDLVTVRCAYYPDIDLDKNGKLETVLAEYKLTKKEADE
jgi:hypothetical protein